MRHFENSGIILAKNSEFSLKFEDFINKKIIRADRGSDLRGKVLHNFANMSTYQLIVDRVINEIGANMWMYFHSDINHFQNNGHIEFFKGLHAVEHYVGGAGSEILTVKESGSAVIPLYTAENRFLAAKRDKTTVRIKKIEGGSIIKSARTSVSRNLEQLKNSVFQSDVTAALSTFPLAGPEISGGNLTVAVTLQNHFTNPQAIFLPFALIRCDARGKNFENSGSILCRGLGIGNAGGFLNKGCLETDEDAVVEAQKIANEGEIGTENRQTGNISKKKPAKGSHVYWDPGDPTDPRNFESFHTYYKYNKVGSCTIRSHSGSVILRGRKGVSNKYSSIIAQKNFLIESPEGEVSNHVGNIFSFGNVPSTVKAKSFTESCDKIKKVKSGKFHRTSGNILHKRRDGFIFEDVDQSDKAEIYAAGDLRIETEQAPVIKGSDIKSGGTIRLDFGQGEFQAESVFHNIPVTAAREKILVNGKDIGINQAVFLAGRGIAFDAAGNIFIGNSSGETITIASNADLDISLSDLARRRYSALTGDVPDPLQEDNSLELRTVPAQFTSQRCSRCGEVDKASRKSQSKFECTSCGFKTNADYNAAKNILAAGLAVSACEASKMLAVKQEPACGRLS